MLLRPQTGRNPADEPAATRAAAGESERPRASERRELLAAIVDSSDDAIVAETLDGVILAWNRSAERIYGYSAEEVLGKPTSILIPQGIEDELPSMLERARRGETVRDYETLRRAKDGRILNVSLTISPTRDPTGRINGASAIARDVTLRTQAADAMRESDGANQAKSEFLAATNHELRAPLNAILGFGQLLEMEDLGLRTRHRVEQILNAGRHLLALIDQLGDISQIEMGVLSVSLEPLEVGGALRDAVALIAPMAREGGIELIVEPADEHCVSADRQRLRQVILNLLSNAVKYNHPGGSITVSVRATAAERTRIHVADTGRGVEESDLERLFVPFERLGAEDGEVQGSGLGLALSRSMVEQMGGTLTARSEPGRGSIFTVELATCPSPPGEGLWEGGGRADEAVRKQTVLYIEDNVANFKLVEEALSLQPGLQVMLAIQGGLGIDVARLHHPDLILLDLKLPDMSGEQVLKRLAADPETSAIPVIILSADARPASAERLLAAGAQEYLTKPLDIKRFLAVVNSWLSAGTTQ